MAGISDMGDPHAGLRQKFTDFATSPAWRHGEGGRRRSAIGNARRVAHRKEDPFSRPNRDGIPGKPSPLPVSTPATPRLRGPRLGSRTFPSGTAFGRATSTP